VPQSTVRHQSFGAISLPLKVVIVGGSIAGLVLAHSLHCAGIDYVVLEAGATIDPQVGASIGIFSNGARILDQLGVYDEIERFIESPLWNESLTGEGKLLQRTDALQLIEARYVHIPYFFIVLFLRVLQRIFY